MKLARVLALLVVPVGLLSAAVVARCSHDPPRAKVGAVHLAARETPQWLDATEAQGADLFPALEREVDAVCEPPHAGYDPIRAAHGLDPARWDHPTLRHAEPTEHPTNGARWALPVDSCARQAIANYVASRCAGKSGGQCAHAKSLPAPAASLDSSWQAERDPVAAPPRAAPPDALDGGTL